MRRTQGTARAIAPSRLNREDAKIAKFTKNAKNIAKAIFSGTKKLAPELGAEKEEIHGCVLIVNIDSGVHFGSELGHKRV